MPDITKYKTEIQLITGTKTLFSSLLQKSINDGFMYLNELSTTTVNNNEIVYSAVVTKTTIPHE